MSTIAVVKISLHCVGHVGVGEHRRSCPRRVTWHIRGVGDMCNYCFEIYFDKHWRSTDLDRVARLSDNDRDFIVKSTAGMGYGGRPRGTGKKQIAAASMRAGTDASAAV